MTQRLFAAVDLPPEARDSWRGLLASGLDASPEIRWTRPENLHVTLRFFGELGGGQAPWAADLLAKAAAGHGPFSIRYGALGSFPSLGVPRILYWGVLEGGGPLGDLAADIDRRASDLGWAARGAFQAHVTLGRIKPGGSPAAPIPLRDWAVRGWGPVTVDSCSLYQSFLETGGPVYRRLREFRLTGS